MFKISNLISIFLLDNSYLTLGSMCFIQLIEIHIGPESTFFMAKLFLYCHEKERLLQVNKQDLQKIHVFSNIIRFIDDPSTFDNDECGNNYNDIYPDELKLKKENEDPYIALLL